MKRLFFSTSSNEIKPKMPSTERTLYSLCFIGDQLMKIQFSFHRRVPPCIENLYIHVLSSIKTNIHSLSLRSRCDDRQQHKKTNATTTTAEMNAAKYEHITDLSIYLFIFIYLVSPIQRATGFCGLYTFVRYFIRNLENVHCINV